MSYYPQNAPLDSSAPPAPRNDKACAFARAAASHAPRSEPIGPALHVLTAITNPCRYASRYRLFEDFAKRVSQAGAILHIAEAAFGERPHELIPDDPELVGSGHLRLRTSHEIWHKENLLNLLVHRLPEDWKYCAWLDADILFARPDWVGETIHQLQHHGVVQMFSEALDLGPDETPFDRYPGFAASYLREGPGRKSTWHPGYAWGWRRDALEAVGGFIDCAILGSADQHMACGLIGEAPKSINPRMHPRYHAEIARWQARAERFVRRNIGFVPGTLLHHWHGRKSGRGYMDRWKILVDYQYDPLEDLRRDPQGLYQLYDDGSERFIRFRDEIRAYFRSRNEDGNEL